MNQSCGHQYLIFYSMAIIVNAEITYFAEKMNLSFFQCMISKKKYLFPPVLLLSAIEGAKKVRKIL